MRGLHYQRGNLIVGAVLIVVVLSAFGITVIRTLTSTSASSARTLELHQSDFLAESALEYADWQIKNNLNIDDPTVYCDGNWKTTQTFGEGEFRFKCTQYSPSITTTAEINSSAMIIPISSLTNVAPIGRVQIDSEQIDYGNTSTDSATCGIAPCLLVRKRGANNTIAASHVSNSTISQTQLVVESEGAVPTTTNPDAKKLLQQAIVATPSTYLWAVGASGAVFQRVNNIWQQVGTSPPSGNSFEDVACYDSADCWIVGDVGTRYRWNGSIWVQYADAISTKLMGVACPAENQCWMFDSSKNIYEWNGSNWSFYQSSSENLEGISCASSSMCIIVGKNGLIMKWNGTSWGTMSSPTSKDLFDVSCPSTSTCFAVGDDGTIIKMTGSSWASETSPTIQRLITISCANTNDCWALTDNVHDSARYQSGTWTNEALSFPDQKTLYDVSCLTANECYLSAERLNPNRVLIGIWNGSSWGQDAEATAAGGGKDLYAIVAGQTPGGVPIVTNIVWREVFK